jgi:H/ACA ribonucleoprotein complex subunit 3
MRKCVTCGKYTLSEEHCGSQTRTPHPPRFSIDDKYAEYRRKARES